MFSCLSRINKNNWGIRINILSSYFRSQSDKVSVAIWAETDEARPPDPISKLDCREISILKAFTLRTPFRSVRFQFLRPVRSMLSPFLWAPLHSSPTPQYRQLTLFIPLKTHLKCFNNFISLKVLIANMVWSKGVIRLMATWVEDWRWVAELYDWLCRDWHGECGEKRWDVRVGWSQIWGGREI